MLHQKLTPTQKAAIEEEVDRRRRKRRRREDEYRRRIERLRRQIEEARRRRQRLLLILLLAILAMQESIMAAFQRSYTYQPDPDPEPSNWTPDPTNDYAPRAGDDDHCDGYSYSQWNRMLNERGIRLSREGERLKQWKSDPDYELFPRRYREWGHKPHLGQVMDELTAKYWRADALMALKLLIPREAHLYLDEAYATDPGDLRRCLAERDADIVRAFQTRALLWEERKRKEAEEAKREQKLSRKNDDDQGLPKPD